MSTTKRIGRALKNVTYIYSQPEKIRRVWDDLPESVEAEKLIVYPVFPADGDNPKSIESGTNWAENKGRYYYDEETKKNIHDKNPKVYTDAQSNVGRPGYRVVNLERRSEGGRAWKAITPEGYYVDLREDVLLDIMVNHGIDKGGYISAPMLWARVGSQMKLIREGSELHKALTAYSEDVDAKPLTVKDLEPFGVYELPNGSVRIFVGLVRMDGFESNNEGYTWTQKPGTGHLWIVPYYYTGPGSSARNDQELFDESVNGLFGREKLSGADRRPCSYRWEVLTSVSARKKIGSVTSNYSLQELTDQLNIAAKEDLEGTKASYIRYKNGYHYSYRKAWRDYPLLEIEKYAAGCTARPRDLQEYTYLEPFNTLRQGATIKKK